MFGLVLIFGDFGVVFDLGKFFLSFFIFSSFLVFLDFANRIYVLVLSFRRCGYVLFSLRVGFPTRVFVFVGFVGRISRG